MTIRKPLVSETNSRREARRWEQVPNLEKKVLNLTSDLASSSGKTTKVHVGMGKIFRKQSKQVEAQYLSKQLQLCQVNLFAGIEVALHSGISNATPFSQAPLVKSSPLDL